jgi:hypothetical protein
VQALTFNVFNLTAIAFNVSGQRMQDFVPSEEHVSGAQLTASEVSRSECVDPWRHKCTRLKENSFNNVVAMHQILARAWASAKGRH